MSLLPTTFDPFFAELGGRLPVAFLRALGKRESGLNPNGQTGTARGLLQVVQQVVDGYNDRYGTHYAYTDMFDPATNVKVASELLNRIVTGYGKHKDKNLKEDWANPEFVKLVVAGWNSGYSEAGGVGKVASYLESHGLPVTHDNVYAYAAQAGATANLQRGDKQAWQRTVSDLYFQQPDRAKSFGVGMAVIGAVGLLVLGIWKWMDRKGS